MDIRKAVGNSTAVSLEDMLEARERRAAAREGLTAVWGMPIVCFSLNIPGKYKLFPQAIECFEEGTRSISRMLAAKFGAPAHVRENRAVTGCEAFYAVDGDAGELKRALLSLEESHPLGRLFDADVYDKAGRQLNRSQYGGKERRCLLCDSPVWVCVRLSRHSTDDLLRRAVGIMEDYFNGRVAEDIARLAVRALLTEACVAPKPGLVDRIGAGSHRDMDIFTFIDGSCSLFSYFREVALFCRRDDGDAPELLRRIRHFGLAAEDAMYASTGGVNTQKGAIYSLGLICAAAGYLQREGEEGMTAEALLALCSVIAREETDALRSAKPDNPTHGEALYLRHGLTGIRGEAAKGFPSVRDCALPVLREAMGQGYSLEQASVAALLHLIARADDTNMISRSDLSLYRDIQEQVRRELGRIKEIPRLITFAKRLGRRFVELNLSPGGCADLLAVAIFVDSLTDV